MLTYLLDMEQKFLEHIKNAQRILVTAHISPDPDAVCSALLLANTIKANFPGTSVSISLENEPVGLEFLVGYDGIDFVELSQAIEKITPDLLIAVDSPNLQRCTRLPIKQVSKKLSSLDTYKVGIDHHQPDDSDSFDLYLNRGGPAAVQEVYEICFDVLKLKKPEGYAETTMLGIYSDTGGFIYKNTRPRRTFELVADLVDEGVNLESIHSGLNAYSMDHIKVFGELADNIKASKDYTYTYISDGFYKDWQADSKSPNIIRAACHMFIDNYIRNIDNRRWGFIVYPDPLIGLDGYSVSLRSEGDIKDVSMVAKKLGGGGHKPAAGAKIKAKDIVDAIAQVESAIAS